MSAPMICVPGQRLCAEEEKYVTGQGTYKRNGFIYSSLAGYLSTTKNDDSLTVIEVLRNAEPTVLPTVNALVTARVTKIGQRFCRCDIIKVGSIRMREAFSGMIRKDDVRATEKDKIEIYKSFRPGDIILARVISLGDAQSYLLTTAENELGVVVATSEAGATMVPISWCKMRCPKTLQEEFRKVAKVQHKYIEYSGT